MYGWSPSHSCHLCKCQREGGSHLTHFQPLFSRDSGPTLLGTTISQGLGHPYRVVRGVAARHEKLSRDLEERRMHILARGRALKTERMRGNDPSPVPQAQGTQGWMLRVGEGKGRRASACRARPSDCERGRRLTTAGAFTEKFGDRPGLSACPYRSEGGVWDTWLSHMSW